MNIYPKFSLWVVHWCGSCGSRDVRGEFQGVESLASSFWDHHQKASTLKPDTPNSTFSSFGPLMNYHSLHSLILDTGPAKKEVRR
jgi:hypothetical protein